jgi:hypothetical protein
MSKSAYVNAKVSITPSAVVSQPKVDSSGGIIEREIYLDKFIKVKIKGKTIEIY